MSLQLLIIVFAVSFFLLARSSSFLVRSLTGIARLLHISGYLIAFVLMSFATSVSELFIGISSAVSGAGGLSLGNVMGANLLNITVIIGLMALISGAINVESKISRENFWLIFFMSLLPFLLGFDGIISRADGLILIVGFVIYLWHILGEREYFSKVINNNVLHGLAGIKKVFRILGTFILSVVVLMASSAILVWSGTQIADLFSFPLLSFGIIFVAIGTTVPELAFGVAALARKQGSMAVGNSLGSIAFNSAFIIGIVSLIRPIVITDLGEFYFVMGAFALAFVLFNIFVYHQTSISRKEGILLLGVYALFIVLELFL